MEKFTPTTKQLITVKKLQNKIVALYKIHEHNSSLYGGVFLNPYTFFLQSGNMLDLNAIFSEYPILKILGKQFIAQCEASLDNDFDIVVYIYTLDKSFPINDFKELLSKHNKNYAKLPNNYELVEEKPNYLSWIGYNTASVDNIPVTPLTGTENMEVTMYNSVINYYKNWMITSFYLALEANQLIPALIYLSKFFANNPTSISSLEKNAYTYWQSRQVETILADLLVHLNRNNVFMVDFTSPNIMYREILEDLTYVSLNLILAKTILDFIHTIDLNNVNSEEFFSKIKSIIANHYLDYADGYLLLSELRKYTANHFISTDILKNNDWKI